MLLFPASIGGVEDGPTQVAYSFIVKALLGVGGWGLEFPQAKDGH